MATPPSPPDAPDRRGRLARWWDRWNVRARLRAVLYRDGEPGKIAGGLAVGAFISFSPYYGLHTFMGLAAAFLLRLNVAATLVGCWLVIPPAIPFAMAFCLKVGWFLVGRPGRVRGPRPATALAFWERVAPHLWPLVVGTTAVGFVAAAVVYVLAYRALLAIRRARARGAQVQESRASEADFHLDKDPPGN
jgi:hypothetical protein